MFTKSRRKAPTRAKLSHGRDRGIKAAKRHSWYKLFRESVCLRLISPPCFGIPCHVTTLWFTRD
eukprot:2021546-Rhodomonas_salina.2